jgi:hypothetical protein
MSNLDSHVPDLDRCRRMAAVPALREAFGDSYFVWQTRSSGPELTEREFSNTGFHPSPAPLVDEMLAWLDCGGWNLIQRRGYGGLERWAVLVGDDDAGEAAWYRITDPNALADACLAAAGVAK